MEAASNLVVDRSWKIVEIYPRNMGNSDKVSDGNKEHVTVLETREKGMLVIK